MYEQLIADLKEDAEWAAANEWETPIMLSDHLKQAIEAIETLYSAGKKMHTWIFLNSGDEEEAYEECGLTDEMNAALGYGGKLVLKEGETDV